MGKLSAPGKLLAPAKRLAPVMAILAIMLIPAIGHALGLGNISMKSALNQPLDAQIELLSVQKGDLNNLTVKLGSAEDFQRVGADRAFFLTRINFEVVRRKNGTAYVHLTTTKTVTEPFLDFVVEARWPRGRILREFTVLVDPPVLSDEAPAPLQQAAVATQRAAPASVARPAPIPSRATMAPVPRQSGELTYGPVQYNDTLYEIASQMRPAGVTVDQMMLALVRNNPNAFYGSNVNQLKAGYVLRIDDINELSAFSVAEANAEINRQHREWRARKSGKLVRQADSPTGGRVARGEGTGAGSARDQASLKLVAPGSKGAGSGAGDESIDQLREDLLLAAEALDADRQETDELKSRLTEMEEQLEAMQRLIMLKDDELQALQVQAGAEPEPTEAEMPAPETMTEEAVATEALNEEGAEAETEAPVGGEKAVEPAAPVAEPGLLDDPVVMYGGLGVLLLLIIAAVIQRRRKMQDGFEESILNVGGVDDNAGATAESMGGGESSMVSDFAMSEMSGMSSIETDAADVDPVSEADVYLAYGRHQQAEDILREALEKEPDRHEIRLKLLEVFFAARDRESFEQQAQELHDVLGDESDPVWARVVTMGAQLCPGSDLFGGDSVEALKEDLEESIGESDDDLLDFDFDIDTENLDADAATGDAKTDEMFAELEAATSDNAVAEKAPTVDDDNSLDFDMDMGSDASPETTKATSAKDGDDSVTDDNSLDFDVSSLDFNLNADTDSDTNTGSEIDTGSETDTVSVDDDNSLDFDLGDIDDAVITEDPISGTEADDEIKSVAESGDELGDDVFGEVDEIGTKLDLAKAYIDMGDGDGARSILEEVMEEGDAAQKKQAEELLSQVS